MATLGERVSRLLNYDFCPSANRWVYWVKTPIASLSLAALSGLACALFVKPIALIAFAAVLVVVVLGYVWPAIAIRGMSASLKFRQRRVDEGDVAIAVLQVVNRWPWPVWGLSLEEGFGQSPTLALAKVGELSSAEFSWEFVPDCRGEYPQATPRLMTGFPFGLRHASRPVAVEQTILVWPEIVELDTLLDAAETRPSDDVFSEQRVGESGDMTGTRPFRQGDSLRRVHWAQTARTGRMIVCERQAPAQAAVRVVFDSDPRVHSGQGRNSSLEWSIRLAASVCAAYHREHSRVECCFGHETLAVEPGAAGWQQFLDRLARFQPCIERHHPGCDHEHTAADCRKIHHHNCGTFQVTVTTDVGLAHRTEHRHVHGDQRLVVLETSGFDGDCRLCHHTHPAPSRRAIVINDAQHVAADFQRKWRQACHVG